VRADGSLVARLGPRRALITPFHDTATVGLRQQLDPGQRALAQAMERLASGLRINRAADDASGQATATVLSARARSWSAAKRSIEAGMDAARIASGGLGDASTALTRLRELAIQAANGTLTDSQRGHLQIEAAAITQQVDQVASATRYNGRSLLAPYRVQVAVAFDTSGTMAGEHPTLLAAMQAFRDDLAARNVDVQLGLAAVRQTLDVVDGVERVVDFGEAGFDTALASLPIASGGIDPYSALLETSGATSVAGTNDPDAFGWSPDAAERHLVWVSDAGREVDLVPGPDSEASVAAALAATGIETHAIVLPAANNIFDTLTATTGGTLSDLGDGSGSGIPVALQALADAIAARAPSASLDIQTGINGSTDDWIDSGLPVDATARALGVRGLSIATQDDARDALAVIDAAIETVSSHHANVGALSRRLEAAFNEARTHHFAAESTRSRIEDVDIAEAETQRVSASLRVQGTAEVLLRAADVQRQAILALLAP
jgi:flagellin